MMQDQEQAQKTFVKDLQDGKDVQQSLDKFLDQQNDELEKMMDHIQQSCSQNPHCTQQIFENASEICSQGINWKLEEEELFSSTELFH